MRRGYSINSIIESMLIYMSLYVSRFANLRSGCGKGNSPKPGTDVLCDAPTSTVSVLLIREGLHPVPIPVRLLESILALQSQSRLVVRHHLQVGQTRSLLKSPFEACLEEETAEALTPMIGINQQIKEPHD